MYDEVLIDQIMEELHRKLDSRFVLGMEEHYAGYFDELGITVNLADFTPHEEFELMASQALIYLNTVLPLDGGKFKWILSFYQSLQEVGLFTPGDGVGDNFAAP